MPILVDCRVIENLSECALFREHDGSRPREFYVIVTSTGESIENSVVVCGQINLFVLANKILQCYHTVSYCLVNAIFY
jgi:hypothetical protein